MKIGLMNCYNEEQNFEIDDKKLRDFLVAVYEIFAGDEVLTIIYKNGEEEYFDSDTHCRIESIREQTTYLVNVNELNLLAELNIDCDSYDRGEKLDELVIRHRKKTNLRR